LKELYANDMSLTTIDAIEYHAAALGHSICENFATLRDFVARHEALIRKRWIKKSPLQRREVLLAAWPDMQPNYRPNDQWCSMPYSKQKEL
jgi:hypothetical protein